MLTLVTSRLLLVSTPLNVIQTRLARADFEADVQAVLADSGRSSVQTLRVRFPSEWPGDALALFPLWAEHLAADPERGQWGGTMIERASRIAVGQMSFMTLPDSHGVVELGYGVNRSYQGKGYATEMARELVAWALRQPAVRSITATCRADNHPSVRVLEKVGFREVGRRVDGDEELIEWEWRPDGPSRVHTARYAGDESSQSIQWGRVRCGLNVTIRGSQARILGRETANCSSPLL